MTNLSNNNEENKKPPAVYKANRTDSKINISEFEKAFNFLFNNQKQADKNFAVMQIDKNRYPQTTCDTTKKCLDHLLSEPINATPTIGLLLQNLQPQPFICLDIDDENIGININRILNTPSKLPLFHSIMGYPFIVETRTPNHFHFYYKKPPEANHINTKKKAFCTRLGFTAEYSLEQITFASRDRCIKNRDFSILDASVLPYNLFPHNYFMFQPKGYIFKDLLRTELSTFNEKQSSLIKDNRNQTIFKFIQQENFSQNHIAMIYELCCVGAPSPSDLKGLSNKYTKKNEPTSKWKVFEFSTNIQVESNQTNISQNIDSTPDQSIDIIQNTDSISDQSIDIIQNTDSIPQEETGLYRTPPGYKNTEQRYQSLTKQGLITRKDAFIFQEYEYHPKRFRQAFLNKTDILVISFVAHVEYVNDIFLEDKDWMGLSLEACVINYLSNYKDLNVRFLEEEESWYVYKDRFWDIAGDDDVMGLIFQLLTENVKFGGIESKMRKNDTLNLLRPLKLIPKWPLPISGYNFLDCVLHIDENNQEHRLPHNPKYNFRSIIATSSWPEPFTLEEMRLIQDISNGNVVLINIFRYILWSALSNGSNNIGVYFQGLPGASKTTIYCIFDSILPKKCSTLNVKIVSSNPFELLGLARGKLVLNVPDINQNTLGNDAIRTLNTALGRDPMPGQEKYKSKLSNFKFKGTVIIQGNTPSNLLKVFQERSVLDRFIIYAITAVEQTYQVSSLDTQLATKTKNFNALVHWALRMPPGIPQQYQRVGAINDYIMPVKTIMESFGFNYLIKQVSNKLDIKDLYEKFRTFVKEEQSVDEDRVPKGYTKTFFREKFAEFYAKTISKTDKIFRRYGNKTSVTYVNDINFKPEDGILKENQELLQTNLNEASIEELKQNPFFYSKLLFFDLEKGFVLGQNELPSFQIFAQLCAKISYNLSLAHLFGKFVSFHQPNCHLITRTSNNVPGPRLDSLPFWNKYPIFPIPKKPNDAFELKTFYNYYINTDRLTDSVLTNNTFQSLDIAQIKSLEPQIKDILFNSQNQTEQKIIDNNKKILKAYQEEIGNFTYPFEVVPEISSIDPEDPLLFPFNSKNLTKEGVTELQNSLNAISVSKNPNLNFTLHPVSSNLSAEEVYEMSEKSSQVYNSFYSYALPVAEEIQNKLDIKQQIPQYKQYIDKIDSFTESQNTNFHIRTLAKILIEDFGLNQEELVFAKVFLVFLGKTVPGWEICSDNIYYEYINALINFNQRSLGSNDFLLNLKKPYESYLKPYEYASCFEEAISIYNLEPIYYFGNLIKVLNDYYLIPALMAWEFLQKNGQEHLPKNSRFLKTMVGSSSTTQKETKKNLILQIENYLNSNNTFYDKNKFEKILTKVKSDSFEAHSLFAWAYQKGQKGYGRVISIPGTTISNLGTKIKQVILKTIANQGGVCDFLEIDLKACHTVFFKALFASENAQIKKIPLSKFWSTFVEQFAYSFKDKQKWFHPELKNFGLNWTEDQAKSLLKTQWYKALNGGNCFYCVDTLNQNLKTLGLRDFKDLDLVAKDISEIFNKMPMFKEVDNFQKELYKHRYIYLPTQKEPFDTETLSSEKGQKRGVESRLYSSLEMALIIILNKVLSRHELAQCVIPISYEQDGLLLCTHQTINLVSIFQGIQTEFNIEASKLLKEEVILEYKFDTSKLRYDD